MKTIGIFGGSFNPVHLAHIALARAIVESGHADEVWMVMSPLNPLKISPEELASDADRLAMLQLAVEEEPAIKACDIELTMPRPSYTVDTMKRLSAEYPDYRFRLIIGADNWTIFDKWKSCDELLENYPPIIYPRPGYPLAEKPSGGAEFVDLPQIDLSSTEIRRKIANAEPVNNSLPGKVYRYILNHNLYSTGNEHTA